MSVMSCSPVVRPSARMETLFSSITEQLILAWHWLLVASALSSHGSTHIAVQQVHSRSNGNANPVLAQLAPSDALDTPRVPSLYLGRISVRGPRGSRSDTADPCDAPRPMRQLLASVLLVRKGGFNINLTMKTLGRSNRPNTTRWENRVIPTAMHRDVVSVCGIAKTAVAPERCAWSSTTRRNCPHLDNQIRAALKHQRQ
jgi:hypothetical protein